MSELIAAAERAMRVKRCPFCTYDHTIGPLCKYAGEHIAQVAALAAEQPQDALPVFVLYKGPRTMLHAKVLGVHFDETQTVVTIETPPAPAEQPQPISGWRLVPVEPTDAMKRAAVVYANGNAVYKNVAAEALAIEEGIYGETYEAMLAAAPPPPAAAPIEVTDAMVEAARAELASVSLGEYAGSFAPTEGEMRAAIDAALAAREGR